MSSGQYDQETLDKWLDEDLARIHDEILWKKQKKGKVGDHEAVCFVHKQKDDSFWWFKVVASMPDATLAQARCVPSALLSAPSPPSLDRFGLSKLIFTPSALRRSDLFDASFLERKREWNDLFKVRTTRIHFHLFVALFRSFLIILIQINNYCCLCS
jgi:hypothetical protein